MAPPLNSMEVGLLWNGSQFVSIASHSEFLNSTEHDNLVIWAQSDENHHSRDFWLMDIPRNINSLFDTNGCINQEIELSRKRRFDSIQDLHEEVAKRAKRNPIKLIILGNLTRKRNLDCSDATASQISDEEDPGPSMRMHKKMKEPAY